MMIGKRPSPWILLALTPLVLALCLMVGVSRLGIPNPNILRLRMDRVLTGFMIGAALAAAGTVFQALLRNPLAEPYVLGVSSGAGLGAALAILLGSSLSFLPASLRVFLLPISAFSLASATLFLVYALACRGGRIALYSLILSGVVVSSVCSSLLMFIVAILPREGMHSIMWWMLGDLEVYFRPVLQTGSAIIAVAILTIWLLAPELNALTLGQEMAHYVGVRTRTAITLGLALATLATATAVSMAGLIGFVGLIVPHAARHLFGPDHRRLVPTAALLGGLFLAVCDAVARRALAPQEIPVGVITALIGGPFFLIILHRRRKSGWIE